MSDLNEFGQTRVTQKQADLAAHLLLSIADAAAEGDDKSAYIAEVARVYGNIEHNARLVKQSLLAGLPEEKNNG